MLQTTYLHSGWEFAEASWKKGSDDHLTSPGWLAAEVPGHVHLDLVRNGIIADPFSAMNELGCQWVDEKDWSYRTTFEWQPREGLPKRVLRFDGLDTVCSIFLNDEKIGDHDNMFVSFEIDVTSQLVAGTNTLRIDFESAVRVGNERRNAYFTKQGLSLDTERFPERSFVRKGQYMFGWDWGPRLVSCGIWKPIRLIEYAARILDVHVQVVPQDNGSVKALGQVEIEGEGVIVSRVLGGGEANFGNSFEAEAEEELWRPGHPWTQPWRTYLLPAGFDVAQVPDAIPIDEAWDSVLESNAIDFKETRIGFNTVKLVQEADQYGESFEFEVNGEKLWARGANWIPDHSFPSTISRAQLRDRLEKAKDMGFNMLRVWGGGFYESDDFYELCDELGILVWQDFPFGCAYYPDTDEWQGIIRDEAAANIKRLRNHPCLALWCGNNENEEMFYSKWGNKDKHPSRYFGENLYNDVLPAVLAELDPDRSYIRTSPIGNAPVDNPDAPKQRGPNSGGYGDQHCWDVWHGRGDWKFYTESTGRFSSEYGFASSCSLATWDKVLDDWAGEYPFSIDDPVIRWHDKTRKGFETFVGYSELHYPKSSTLADWVYYSQLNQRDALKCGVEHYRRSVFCRGSLIWQLNDCWPVQSWAILDSDGHYKALAYELRRLYADSLLSIERHNDEIKVHAMNDGREAAQGVATLIAYELSSGKVTMEAKAIALSLEPDERKVVIEASVKGLSVPDTILVASWGDVTAWTLLAEPKQARFAPASPILASTSDEGYLTLKLDAPAVDLMLTDEDDVANFHDNFVTAVRPGIVQVRYWGSGEGLKARSLAGWHPIRVTRSPV